MTPKIKQFLCQAAQTTPSADNSQPWKLSWQDNTLSISYDTQRVENRNKGSEPFYLTGIFHTHPLPWHPP